MKDVSPVKTKKPSQLEQFQLFYEAVPAPDYIAKANADVTKPSAFRDRRLSRARR